MYEFILSDLADYIDIIKFAHAEYSVGVALYLFAIGTVLASFGGVCIDRLPHQMEWIENPRENYTISYPRSSCNTCHKKLGILDVTPIVGWLVNRGRCRTCKSSIPWRYPVTEFVLGLVFAAATFWFDDIGEVVAFCLLSACMFVITGLDIKHHWIPAVITTPLIWLGLLWSPFESDMTLRVFGAMLGGGTVAFVFWFAEKRTGMDLYSGGDVAFLAFMGAWIGVFHVFNFLILASVIFAVHAGWLRWKRGTVMVPWGPHLSLAALIYLAAIG